MTEVRAVERRPRIQRHKPRPAEPDGACVLFYW
jgi:hypothetical protein